MEIRKNVKTS